MGTKRRQPIERTGIKPASASSIEISFTFQGVRCRERIKLEPTPTNLKRVEQHRASILEAIYRGTFDYAFTFPNSSNAKKFAVCEGQIITIGQYLTRWLVSQKSRLKASTYDGYRKIVFNVLEPAFSDLNMTELTRKHIKEWAFQQSAGQKRINNILSVLRKALDDAIDDDILEVNILAAWTPKVKNQNKVEDEIDPFSMDEQALIIAHCDCLDIANAFTFLFWSGLRPSEFIALNKDDLDFKKNTIRINKAMTRAAKGVAEVTKTKSGTRFVKMLKPAREALMVQMKLTGDHEAVFLNPKTGERFTGDQEIREIWVKVLAAAKVRYRWPYQMRHTYASMMLSAGEHPMWVAQQMGHKDWTMIARVYGRWIPEANKESGDKAVNIFGKSI